MYILEIDQAPKIIFLGIHIKTYLKNLQKSGVFSHICLIFYLKKFSIIFDDFSNWNDPNAQQKFWKIIEYDA